jgi:hypothetical protein
MPMPRSSSARRAAPARLSAPAALLLLVAAGCGGGSAPLAGSLDGAQRAGLNRTWSQRITATSASSDEAVAQATKLYRTCATLEQGSTFLQAVHATCAPTAVSVKLGAVLPQRCATPTRQCVRVLDRAKAANDTLLASLLQLSDAVKTVTQDRDCRAEFTTDAARAQRYRDLSTAYDALALGIERGDTAITKLGRRRVEEANAAISSRLTANEQIARFRQACGIADDA